MKGPTKYPHLFLAHWVMYELKLIELKQARCFSTNGHQYVQISFHLVHESFGKPNIPNKNQLNQLYRISC